VSRKPTTARFTPTCIPLGRSAISTGLETPERAYAAGFASGSRSYGWLIGGSKPSASPRTLSISFATAGKRNDDFVAAPPPAAGEFSRSRICGRELVQLLCAFR